MVDGSLAAGAQVPPLSGEAHVQIAKCISGLARMLELAEAGELESSEARLLAKLTSDSAQAAVAATGRPMDLLIGRSTLQNHGESLRAPSWVYDAGWEIASRLTPGAICALHVPGTTEPEDVVELARGRASGASRIRAFGLPGKFAALVEAQDRAPGAEERLAVILVGVRKQLAAARGNKRGSMQVWTSIARSVVELCEEQPRWVRVASAHALASDREAWLVADAASLAVHMTNALDGDRRARLDVALAVLMVAGLRAWAHAEAGPTGAWVGSLQDWVLTAGDAEHVPPTCLVLVGELDHLVGGDPVAAPRWRGPSLLGRIVESSWWMVHESGLGEGAGETELAAALGGWDNEERRSDDVTALLISCAGLRRAETATVSEAGAAAPEGQDQRRKVASEGERTGAAGETKPFTEDELGSFLDEFVAWGAGNGNSS